MKNLVAMVALVLLALTSRAQLTHYLSRPDSTGAQSYIVTDDAGKQYNYLDWRKLVISGNYGLKRLNPDEDTKRFIIYKYTPEQKALRQQYMAKPPESTYFTTGEAIKPFKVTDIYGNTLNAKAWAGKTIVLNFWFTSCKPCQVEIPELNKISSKYANNQNVIFIAIALDEGFIVSNFVKHTPFAYLLVPSGSDIANKFKIKYYPTNVVIDKQGKVRFHASGMYNNNAYWIDKTIEESEAL